MSNRFRYYINEKINSAVMEDSSFFNLKKIPVKKIKKVSEDVMKYFEPLLLRYMEECSVLGKEPELVEKISKNNLKKDEDPILLLVKSINDNKELIHEQILSGINELFEDYKDRFTIELKIRSYDSDIYSSSIHNNYMLVFDFNKLTLEELKKIKFLFAEYFSQSNEELNEGFFTRDMFSSGYPKKVTEFFPFFDVATVNYRIGIKHKDIIQLFKKIKELEV